MIQPGKIRLSGTDDELTASFDPYEGAEKDEATQVKIKWWLSHVKHELNSYRSPLVAAEILLRQLHEYDSKESGIKEELLLSTALPVLHRCAQGLGKYGDLLQRALHEVVPAIMFTRTMALSHGEVLQRVPYAECFSRIQNRFEYHVNLSSSLQHRRALEDEVMSRVVRKLDNLWMKMCFMAWKALCNRINAKKRGFQRLATKASALRVVPGLLRRWRRYAHGITLREKMSKHDALTKHLESLYVIEQGAKSRLERILEEVRERTRSLEEKTVCCEVTENRLEALLNILDETNVSLQDHLRSWSQATTILFNDTHAFRPYIVGNLRNDLQSIAQNITDTSTLFSKEAQRRTWKISTNSIRQFITNAKLRGVEIAERLSPDDFIAIIASICTPVASPLGLLDIFREDQQKYDLTLKFLSCVNDGGHCSLFTSHDFSSNEEKSVGTCKELGKEMVARVTVGIDSLHKCPDTNEKYLQSIRDCLATDERTQVHDYLSRVFCELSSLGLPLQRTKIEACMCTVVEPHESQVICALYPSHGIHSFYDMINYLSKVSEFSSWTITALINHLEMNYDAEPKEDLFLKLYDDEVVNFFTQRGVEISSLFARLRDKRAPMHLSEKETTNLLVEKLDFLPVEVDTLLKICVESKKVTKDEFSKFLLLVAEFLDPSPFVSTVKKLTDVLEQCTESH